MDILCEPQPLVNYHCRVGENPLWDNLRQSILWTDIPAGRLYEYNVLTRQHRRIYCGEPVGGFTLQDDDSLLLFQVNKFSRLLPNGTVQTLAEGIDPDMKRFNDVIADPEGRVYARTIGQDDRKGGLYRIGLDGSVTCLFKGTGCANGMGFSPNHEYFYWTCSTTRTIFRFRYEQATGNLSHREVLLTVPGDRGTPDGMTVDSDGCIWSARWGGSAVYWYSPAGEELGRVRLPVPEVSAVTFGGETLHDLYITTAGGQEDSDTPEGTLYRVSTVSLGRLEYRSRVMME